MHFLVLSVLLAAFSSSAKADIFMLDLNYRFDEVSAAKAAAVKTHQTLVILPNLSDSARKAAGALVDQIDSLDHQAEAIQPKIERDATENLVNPVVQRVVDAIASKRKAVVAALKVINDQNLITNDLILNSIKNLEANNTSLTVVISGHSRGDQFWGSANYKNPNVPDGQDPDTFSFQDLTQILSTTRYKEHLEGLYLNGCYSQTPDNYSRWSGVSSKIDFRVGFGAPGPIGSSPGSYDLLGGLLRQESMLVEINDPKMIEAQLRTNPYFMDTNAVVGIGANLFSRSSIRLLSEVEKCNASAAEFIGKTENSKFFLYYFGESGYEHSPDDPQHSSLRDYYNYFQSIEQCGFTNTTFAENVGGQEVVTVSAEKILSLIFYDSVQKNTCLFYRDDIQDFLDKGNALMGKPSMTLPSCEQHANRSVWITQFAALAPIVSGLGAFGADGTALVKKYQKIILDFQTAIQLNCIPTTWVDTTPASGVKPVAPSQSCLNTQETSGTI